MTEMELLEENRQLKERVKKLEQELLLAREEAGQLLLEAKERCHEMEVTTKEKCNRLETETEKKIEENWKVLSDRLGEFFQEHDGLREMLRPDLKLEDESEPNERTQIQSGEKRSNTCFGLQRR